MEKQKANWVKGSCIGKGAFGTVNLAVNKTNGAVFAVKSVDQSSALPSQVEALENEIKILRKLSSPYVVEYLGDDTTTSYRNLHIEYLPGGTVADMAKKNGADVDEGIVRSYTWCILSALKHLHSQGIVHCDVKGSNVLVGPTLGAAKLADFGSAVEMGVAVPPPRGGDSKAVIMPRGSPLWMAPEVIRREYQGPESDIWSLGCTVIEMFKASPGWEEQNSAADTLCRIGYSNELPQVPTQLSELGKDFLDKCLRREPSKRWSCDQLLHHPFVSLSSPPASFHSSPRCVLDWFNSDSEDDEEEDNKENRDNDEKTHEDYEILKIKAKERIMGLVSGPGGIWESDGWLVVREGEEVGEEGTSLEFNDLFGAERESFGVGLEYSDPMEIGEVRTRTGLESSDSSCSNNYDDVLPCGELARDGLGGQYVSPEGEGENSYYICNLLLFLLLDILINSSIIFANLWFLNMWPMRLYLFQFLRELFTFFYGMKCFMRRIL